LRRINALLQRLASIQLQPGHDEFCWNLHENDKFSVASMYNALILPDVPINSISNNKLWKLKIPLWIKVFRWYLRKGVILTKDNLANGIGMEVRNVFFVIKIKQ
jgi:hypothetical protein